MLPSRQYGGRRRPCYTLPGAHPHSRRGRKRPWGWTARATRPMRTEPGRASSGEGRAGLIKRRSRRRPQLLGLIADGRATPDRGEHYYLTLSRHSDARRAVQPTLPGCWNLTPPERPNLEAAMDAYAPGSATRAAAQHHPGLAPPAPCEAYRPPALAAASPPTASFSGPGGRGAGPGAWSRTHRVAVGEQAAVGVAAEPRQPLPCPPSASSAPARITGLGFGSGPGDAAKRSSCRILGNPGDAA